MSDLKFDEGQYGFAWGPIEVTRIMSHHGTVVLEVKTDTGQKVQIYSSATGRSLRVFRDGKEMCAVETPEAGQ